MPQVLLLVSWALFVLLGVLLTRRQSTGRFTVYSSTLGNTEDRKDDDQTRFQVELFGLGTFASLREALEGVVVIARRHDLSLLRQFNRRGHLKGRRWCLDLLLPGLFGLRGMRLPCSNSTVYVL